VPGPRDLIGRPPLDAGGGASRAPRPERGSAADLRQRLDRLPPGHPSAPADRAAPPAPADRTAAATGDRRLPDELSSSPESWQRQVPRLRARWEEIRARWYGQASPPLDRSNDEPGSWCGDSGRTLSPEQNRQVDAYCDDLSDREQQITARLGDLERSSSGHLVGKEFRRKNPDRLKDKVAAALEGAPAASAGRLLATIPDAVRYTLQYDEREYWASVPSDIGLLRAMGFDLVKVRNSWDSSEYKGINSQWRDAQTGQRFELQFHTRISFEAKQITHHAYEYLRSGRASAYPGELSAFQRQVSENIPVPPGARDLPEFPG
jgi:hypothetical protein